jgi:hypothetical protein
VPYDTFKILAETAARVGLQYGRHNQERRRRALLDRDRYRAAVEQYRAKHPNLSERHCRARVAKAEGVSTRTIDRAFEK